MNVNQTVESFRNESARSFCFVFSIWANESSTFINLEHQFGCCWLDRSRCLSAWSSRCFARPHWIPFIFIFVLFRLSSDKETQFNDVVQIKRYDGVFWELKDDRVIGKGTWITLKTQCLTWSHLSLPFSMTTWFSHLTANEINLKWIRIKSY